MIIDIEKIQAIVSKVVTATNNHWKKPIISIHRIEKNGIYVGVYEKDSSWLNDDATRIALNIYGKECYLLSISLERELRGKGLGKQLYKMCELIACALGCTYMEQTPSGHTYDGDGNKIETRADYIEKLGYNVIRCGPRDCGITIGYKKLKGLKCPELETILKTRSLEVG